MILSLLRSLQFFSVILVIFIAEVAAGVVALAYSSFVSSSTSPLPFSFHSPPHHTGIPSCSPSTPFPLSLNASLRSPSPSHLLVPLLWILSPCKFSIITAAIIELPALCPPHYIRLLNDSGIAWGRVAVSNFEQFIILEY